MSMLVHQSSDDVFFTIRDSKVLFTNKALTTIDTHSVYEYE